MVSLVTFCLLIFGAVSPVVTKTWDYVILGAGPAGLQLGHFMQKIGRDYVILDRANVSGSFFVKFPRHDRLISINKRYTGHKNKEYNWRHDWNSLLSDRDDLRLWEYSQEFFPLRKTLVDYLADYTTKLNLNVHTNVNVKQVQRDDEGLYHLHSEQGQHYSCRTLVVATGLSKANAPAIRGSEHLVAYETMNTDPAEYEGKTVMILGKGNSAFEVADSMFGVTNLIHMFARSRIRLSWATHYVGDLRAINNGLLDTYQLKSQDAAVEGDVEKIEIVKANNKLHVVYKDFFIDNEQPDNYPFRAGYDVIIRCLGFKFDSSPFSNLSLSHRGKYPAIGHNYESTSHPGLFVAGTLSHSLDFRKSAGGFIHGFRYTARTLFNLLEWRNHQVPWPAVHAPYAQILPVLTKRLNEASGIYQMFQVLGDVIIFNDKTREFSYLKEFPIHLVPELYKYSGHQGTKIVMLVLQYGADFSSDHNDPFYEQRAVYMSSTAHFSNFLHPVLYYYSQLPKEITHRPGCYSPLCSTSPDRVIHLVEDLPTLWEALETHLTPLRRFFESVLQKDMRQFTPDVCLHSALTHGAQHSFCPACAS